MSIPKQHTAQRLMLPVLFLLLFILSGCASYAKKTDAVSVAFRQANYTEAGTKLQEILTADRDALLKAMELGLIRHEEGNYRESNRLLEEAYEISENLYGTSITDLLTRSASNATMIPYKSEIFERIYIHYYKMLNYIYLAEEDISRQERDRLLDGVRIEGRRAQTLLDSHLIAAGSYEEAEEDKAKLLNQLLDLFAKLNGEVFNPRELTFRDNAFLHYMIGVMYEIYGELDNARISYERSANVYEKGYVKQYGLSPQMIDQAKFDTARILKTQRDSRWQRVMESLSDTEIKNRIQQYLPGQNAELLVLQEVDMSSPKGELNLLMRLNKNTNELNISPILIGTPEEKAYQLSWFYYLYAPKGILDAVQRIHQEGRYNPNEIRPKTVGIGPLLPVINQIPGLFQALELGVRLAVPLFYYDDAPFKSHLAVNGKARGVLLDADNIASLHMANTLVQAQSVLTEAMAVEALRLSTCVLTGMPPYGCSLMAASTCMADTRSWLTLPHTIRLKRLTLPPGEYTLRITSENAGFRREDDATVRLEKGDHKIIRKRSTYNP